MSNWINIHSFIYPSEAHMAKNLLESENIPVFLKDEMTVQVNNFYSNAVGGVKLLIQEENKEKALDILKESGYISDNNSNKQGKETFPAKYSKICPYCNSEEVRLEKSLGPLFAFLYLSGIPLPLAKRTYHCFGCGKEWKLNKYKQ